MLDPEGADAGRADPLHNQEAGLGHSPTSQLIQLMSGDSALTSVGPGSPCGAAQSTLSKSHSACIHARVL